MLDFAQMVPQINDFTAQKAQDRHKRETALQEALRRLRNAESSWRETQAKIIHKDTKTSWLLSEWREPPHAIFPASPPPLIRQVLAADGSQIVADRHDLALCYALNMGSVVLRYGRGERATLATRPLLNPPDEDLLETEGEAEQEISPRRLATKRAITELETLATLMQDLPAPVSPSLALYDGTLIFWTLEKEPETYRSKMLTAIENAHEIGRQSGVPIVGYISAPRSRDVINALRVSQCPFPVADCDKFCPNRLKPEPERITPACAGTETIVDSDLFARLLAPGERSAVFRSRSKIERERKPLYRTAFCYLHTGSEVARLEFPEWVAQDFPLLEQAHALAYDQAQKGAGYPVALTEAHELAIIRAPERELFFDFMRRRFVDASLPVGTTHKALSKRQRRI